MQCHTSKQTQEGDIYTSVRITSQQTTSLPKIDKDCRLPNSMLRRGLIREVQYSLCLSEDQLVLTNIPLLYYLFEQEREHTRTTDLTLTTLSLFSTQPLPPSWKTRTTLIAIRIIRMPKRVWIQALPLHQGSSLAAGL